MCKPNCYGKMDWILKYPEDDSPKEFICNCEYTNSCLRLTRNKSENIQTKEEIPKACSKCKYEKPFPLKENKNYDTHCGLLKELRNDGLMYCIRKNLREIKRRDECPLEKEDK